MKNFLLMLFAAFALTACGDNDGAVEVETGEATTEAAQVVQGTTYRVVPANSQVLWTGSKVVGGSHQGTIDVTDGTLSVAGNQLAGGQFTIDMASLTVTDLDDANGKGKLEGHLKNEDFFEVASYPTATFELVAAEPVSGNADVTHNLRGNLTMKGVSKSVTIPANVVVTDDMVSAVTPAFTIDRMDWGVKYGSGLAGAVGDNVISDDVKLVINLKAQRA